MCLCLASMKFRIARIMTLVFFSGGSIGKSGKFSLQKSRKKCEKATLFFKFLILKAKKKFTILEKFWIPLANFWVIKPEKAQQLIKMLKPLPLPKMMLWICHWCLKKFCVSCKISHFGLTWFRYYNNVKSKIIRGFLKSKKLSYLEIFWCLRYIIWIATFKIRIFYN